MFPLFRLVGRLWCRTFHGYRNIAYAGRTQYRCRKCSRLFPVPWGDK